MKTCFEITKNDRVMWAFCIAAYVLMANYYSPLSIVRADLDDGNLVEETPFGSSPQEDRFIMVMAVLAMYAALNPDTYEATCLNQIPQAVMETIAEILRDRHEKADSAAVVRERDRLLETVACILQENHMYHLQLAAALMEGPITTGVIEELKNDYDKGNAD